MMSENLFKELFRQLNICIDRLTCIFFWIFLGVMWRSSDFVFIVVQSKNLFSFWNQNKNLYPYQCTYNPFEEGWRMCLLKCHVNKIKEFHFLNDLNVNDLLKTTNSISPVSANLYSYSYCGWNFLLEKSVWWKIFWVNFNNTFVLNVMWPF